MAATALLAVTVLSGCTVGEPEITPLPSTSDAALSPSATATPEPTSGAYYAEEPQSEEEAIRQATEAYEFYLATVAEVYADPSNPDRIDEIAKQGAAEGIKDVAKTLEEHAADVVFDDVFEPDLGSSTVTLMRYEDGSIFDFGSAQLAGCLDTSNRKGTNSDGTPVGFPEEKRARVTVLAVYEHDYGRWYVHQAVPEVDEQGDVLPC